MTLDQWLSDLYAADKKHHLAEPLVLFKAALTTDTGLMAEAEAKLRDLNGMIRIRGERACAYSTRYRDYLKEVLAA